MNKICRICLEEGVLSSIFTRNFNISLSDMIEHCCNIQIRKDDGLPEQICSNCIYKLGVAYHFKQTCESADTRLRQYLGLHMQNKSIDVAIMTEPLPVSALSATNTGHGTNFYKCICKQRQQKKPNSNYKRKPESEKLKRGPKPKPKQVHACHQCDKEFKCQAQLEMHVRTHTGDRPFACVYCPRQFTQKHNLTIHLRIHSGDKPFQCEVCSKRFSAQGNLQTHLKIHTGQKDHVCAICSKSFITSSELTRHMCKHRGVKDAKCDICGAAFVQSRDLKLHKQKKHQVFAKKVPETSITQNDIVSNKNDDVDIEDTSKNVISRTTKKPLLQNLPPVISHSSNVITSTIMPQINQNRIVDDVKGMKQLYHQYSNEKVEETLSCTICGESFDYLSLLAQHYSHRHKDYQSSET